MALYVAFIGPDWTKLGYVDDPVVVFESDDPNTTLAEYEFKDSAGGDAVVHGVVGPLSPGMLVQLNAGDLADGGKVGEYPLPRLESAYARYKTASSPAPR